MCTLAVYFRTDPQYPVIVAANRDEFYRRPAQPPGRIADDPWVVAGLDMVGGGTWLGVNAYDVVAGLLNRRTSNAPDPTRRSRGLLCLEALQQPSVEQAIAHVARDSGRRYNPFNLLVVSPRAASVIGNISGANVPTRLEGGLHLLTNLELNDPECPRIAKSYGLFDAVRAHMSHLSPEDLIATLRGILADHSTPLDPRTEGPPNNLCVHTEHFGTRSSSVLVYIAAQHRFRLWYADGPPCITEYRELTLPDPPAATQKTAGQV